jgi:hypothetical protein
MYGRSFEPATHQPHLLVRLPRTHTLGLKVHESRTAGRAKRVSVGHNHGTLFKRNLAPRLPSHMCMWLRGTRPTAVPHARQHGVGSRPHFRTRRKWWARPRATAPPPLHWSGRLHPRPQTSKRSAGRRDQRGACVVPLCGLIGSHCIHPGSTIRPPSSDLWPASTIEHGRAWAFLGLAPPAPQTRMDVV